MTTENMQRGQQIQDDIADLRRSLSELTKCNIFNVDSSVICRGRLAEPFLARTQTEIKNLGIEKILDRIAELEKEFLEL